MKGASVIFTVVLLVLAHQLSLHLRRHGALPNESRTQNGAGGAASVPPTMTVHYYSGSPATLRL